LGDLFFVSFYEFFACLKIFREFPQKSVVFGDHAVAVVVPANASTVVSVSTVLAVLLLLTFLLLLAFLR
jgi:hypothetical protein